jgi:hypothetical protein
LQPVPQLLLLADEVVDACQGIAVARFLVCHESSVPDTMPG